MSARIRKTVVPAKNSPKSQATRARIMRTAADFISERGSTDFQMNEISDRCRLSKGSLYYYFIDKAGLLDAIFEQVIGDLVVQVEGVVEHAPTPFEAIAEIVIELAKRIRIERPLVFAMAKELFVGSAADAAPADKRFAYVPALIECYLDQAKGEGLLVSSLDSRLAANAIVGACIYTALAFAERHDDGRPIDIIAREQLRLVIDGAATEKGREAIRARREG